MTVTERREGAMELDRKVVLLKACYDMLKKCQESPFIIDIENELGVAAMTAPARGKEQG